MCTFEVKLPLDRLTKLHMNKALVLMWIILIHMYMCTILCTTVDYQIVYWMPEITGYLKEMFVYLFVCD